MVVPRIAAKTGREVAHCSAPGALILAQSEDKLLSFREERVIDPVLSVRLAVKRCALDVNIIVGRVKVDIANRGRLACDGVLDADTTEVWRRDKIDILSRVREESHHAEGDERAHCATVVVARQTGHSRRKELRDVKVAALGGKRRTSSVVVLEDSEESRLVSDVRDALVMQVIKSATECVRSTIESDELGLVVRNKAALVLAVVSFLD